MGMKNDREQWKGKIFTAHPFSSKLLQRLVLRCSGCSFLCEHMEEFVNENSSPSNMLEQAVHFDLQEPLVLAECKT